MKFENMSVNKNVYVYSLFFVILTSISSILLIVCDFNKPSRYDWLFLLPMTFMMLSFIYGKRIYSNILDNPGVALVIGQLYIRNVITPMAMSVGNYYTHFFLSIDNYYIKAIFLMLYEMIVCFAIVKIALKRKNYHVCKYLRKGKIIRFNIYGFILFSVVVLCLILWIAFPVVRGNYWTIFDMMKSGTKDNTFSHFEYVGTGTLERIGSTLFVFLFGFIRILAPAYLIVKIHNKSNGSIYGLSISMILISTQLLFISGSAAETLFTIMVLFILAAQLFSKYRKRMFIVMILVVVFFIVSLFALIYLNYNLGYENLWEYLSWLLNSYFTGIDNVASTFNIIDVNKIETFFYSIFATVPFRNTLFPMEGVSIVDLYTSMSGLGGQIVSTVGIGYHYFFFILAPIFSGITSYYAIVYGYKYRLTNNKWKSVTYLFLSMVLSFTVGIYNIVIVLKMFLQRIIPMLIISNFASDSPAKKEEKKLEK